MTESGRIDSRRQTNPYVGPRSFQESDAKLFFGRDVEARDLFAHLRTSRLLVFYAQSGAGKTSLINARLIPSMRDAGFDVLPVGRVSGTIPDGIQPRNVFTFNLISRLSATNPALAERPHLLRELAQLTLSQFFGASDTHDESAGAATHESVPTLLVIDQFEEVFTTFEDDDRARTDFFQQLRTAQAAFPSLWVLLSMREEITPQLDTVGHLMPNRLSSRFYMQRMSSAAAVDAIREPAKDAGTPFTQDAAAWLVTELRSINAPVASRSDTSRQGRYVEPVQLQVVCFTMWEHLPEDVREIDEDYVRRHGNVNRALAEFYDSTVRIASREAHVPETQVRSWFERKLITAGATRGFVYRGERETADLPNRAVDVLEREHLVRSESRARGVWIELTHDRMIEPIKTSNAAARERRTRRTLGGVAVVGLAALIALAFSLFRTNNANSAALAAQQVSADATVVAQQVSADATVVAQQLSADATVTAQQSSANATLSAKDETLAAQQQSFVQQIQRTTNAAASPVAPTSSAGPVASRTPTALTTPSTTSTPAPALAPATVPASTATPAPTETPFVAAAPKSWTLWSVFEVSAIDAYWVDYNQANGLAVTAGADGTVRVYANPTARPAVNRKEFRPGKGSVYTATFSPDGRRLFTGGVGPLANLYDASSLELIRPLQGHTNDVIASTFNADGSLLATGSFDHSAIIWNLSDYSSHRLEGHTDVVSSVAFPPRQSGGADPAWVATGSWDGTARVWDVESGKEIVRIDGRAGRVWSVAFSPDGKQLLTGSDDGIIRFWDVPGGSAAGEWRQHAAATTSLSFSRDPRHLQLLSTSGDSTALVWDVASKTPSAQMTVGNAIVWSAAFIDEHWLWTVDARGNARVWHDGAASQ